MSLGYVIVGLSFAALALMSISGTSVVQKTHIKINACVATRTLEEWYILGEDGRDFSLSSAWSEEYIREYAMEQGYNKMEVYYE